MSLGELLGELLRYPFMLHALQAGTVVAVSAPVLGWFVVLRRQAFAAHTLGVVSFPGAAGAVFLGLPAAAGYYVCALVGAVLLGRSAIHGTDGPEGGSAAVVGILHTAALAGGLLLSRLYSGMLPQTVGLLFGSFLGVSSAQVLQTVIIAAVGLGTLCALWRPLVLVTLDRELARSRGLPVAALDLAVLVLMAITVAATAAVTGALLIFALLVTPAAAAQRLTSRAAVGVPLAVVIALGVTWSSLALAFYSDVPPGFYLATLSFACYVAAVLISRALASRAASPRRASAAAAAP